jgi:hypothetical protein
MIYECAQALQAKLAAAKFPTVIEYGPRRTTVETYRDHLVIIERDRDATDNLAEVNGQQTNPRRLCNRALAAKATIYAQSRLDGARVNEHEFECEQIVDALIVALAEWGSAERARLGSVVPTIQEARYLKLSEFQEGEQWPGVVYVLKFRINRGVYKKNYEGAARPTGAAAGVTNVIEIRQNADDPPEVITLP